jgi:hypothetical protein
LQPEVAQLREPVIDILHAVLDGVDDDTHGVDRIILRLLLDEGDASAVLLGSPSLHSLTAPGRRQFIEETSGFLQPWWRVTPREGLAFATTTRAMLDVTKDRDEPWARVFATEVYGRVGLRRTVRAEAVAWLVALGQYGQTGAVQDIDGFMVTAKLQRDGVTVSVASVMPGEPGLEVRLRH